jgi:hypothetical protein
MKYHEVIERDRAEIEILLRSPDLADMQGGLLSAAYYDPDWRWVQGKCLDFLTHTDRDMRWLAAICLGHLARIHRQLDLELVLGTLSQVKGDPLITSGVEDALDDIRFFMNFQ